MSNGQGDDEADPTILPILLESQDSSLNQGGYSSNLYHSLHSVWQDTNNLVKGLSYLPNNPFLEIKTDACNTGWGGHLGPIRVQGLFPNHQLSLNINCKEMLAVHCTLRALLVHVRNQFVLVKTDNVAMKQYILSQGGTGSPALCTSAIELLVWCQSQGITLTAECIPGLQNTLADRLSRWTLAQTEWSLKWSVVDQLFQRFQKPQIDLFASAQSVKLPVYCSWRPDPKAQKIDALSMCWSQVLAYVFLPMALLHKVLLRVQQDQVSSMILVAPRWPNCLWYPLLLSLLTEHPVRLPLSEDFLTQDRGRVRHANPGDLCLVAWPVSGVLSLNRAYQNRLRALSLQPEQSQLTNPMSRA